MDNRLLFSCSYKMSDILSDKVLVSRMQPRKTSVRSACEGGSDSTKLLGGSSAKKWGRSRPICPVLRGNFRGFGFCKSFRTSSVRRASGEEVANLKVQSVILTFFTGFVWNLAMHAGKTPEEISVRAGATQCITLGTEPCPKVGSLQPNPVFCPRPNLIVAPCGTTSN